MPDNSLQLENAVSLALTHGRRRIVPYQQDGGAPAPTEIEQLRNIGNCELLLDAIEGMTFAISGAPAVMRVATVTDLSGNARPVVTQNTFGSVTEWDGAAVAACRFDETQSTRFTVNNFVVPQPCTVITVLKAMTGSASQNMYRDDNLGAVGYLLAPTKFWTIYGGTVFSSTFTEGNSPGRHIRIDVFNGAQSLITRTASEQAGNAGAALGFSGRLNIGCGHSFLAKINMTVGAFIVYSKALSLAERDTVRAILSNRYPGVT